ncbi:MAG TPA: DNA methyltransferase, partial [Rectinema sp.]|nr:DNA methyltransferase [Rectinema sp.]
MQGEKQRAPRNKTLTMNILEREKYSKLLLIPDGSPLSLNKIINKTIYSDLFNIINYLPKAFVDLLIIDPPYNLDKDFNGIKFSKSNDDKYLQYLESWFPKLISVVKPNGSIYICGDWKSTS